MVLTGSADDSVDAYAWSQTTGTPVTLSADGSIAMFTASDVSVGDEALTFRLTVTDDGLTTTDDVRVVVQVAGDDITGFVAHAIGLNFTCGITGDGAIECFGSNYFMRSSPSAGTFTAITAGSFHACAHRPPDLSWLR